jgi:hypothetical protein
MFAKMVLPLLGGTPAVWNTCFVFFQATMLAGYAYAHLTSRRLRLRQQVVLLVIEPSWTLSGQSLGWTLGYVGCAALVATCGWLTWRRRAHLDAAAVVARAVGRGRRA